jgi:hypothetical protein
VPLSDDHGGEAMVGRRDADWAHGNSAITNILLLSDVWVVGVVFADRNAPALGRILDQQRVGNLTLDLDGVGESQLG